MSEISDSQIFRLSGSLSILSFLKIMIKKAAIFIFNAVRIYLAILVSFVTAFLLLALVPLPNNYKFHLVTSGSMEPAIKVGSLVLTVPVETYFPGDIITFGEGKQLTTHRITGFSDEEFGAVYQTKGDANKDIDNKTVGAEKIVGKVILAIPYVGYLLDKIKTPYGFILAVIVPATIVVYEELKSLLVDIKEGIQSFFVRRRKKKDNDPVMQTVISDEKPINKSVFIPIVIAAATLITLTGAFFLDTENSQANNFTAGIWETPPQIAQTLVINEFLWNSSCSPQPEQKFWLELFNGSVTQVNLKDWQFKDGNNNTIQISNANAFIDPNEYVLITKSGSTFSPSCYSNPSGADVLNLGGAPDFTPAATGGIITLEKPTASPGVFEVVDRIEYGPDQNSGVLDTASNQSIERNPNAVDTALGNTFNDSDFQIESSTTPGTQNL